MTLSTPWANLRLINLDRRLIKVDQGWSKVLLRRRCQISMFMLLSIIHRIKIMPWRAKKVLIYRLTWSTLSNFSGTNIMFGYQHELTLITVDHGRSISIDANWPMELTVDQYSQTFIFNPLLFWTHIRTIPRRHFWAYFQSDNINPPMVWDPCMWKSGPCLLGR